MNSKIKNLKYLQKGFVRILLILAALALVVGGVGYSMTKDSPIFDRFYSLKQRELREINRLKKIFPETVGAYTLFGKTPEKIQVRVECNKIEDGEYCGRTISGEYRENSSNKVVFVHLVQFTKGKSAYIKFLQQRTAKDKLNNHDVIRVERHELGWLPGSSFGVILTQEGIVRPDPNGGESMSYNNRATGDNAVTQYFLGKYPPDASSSEIDIPQSAIDWMLCNDSDGGPDYFVKGTVSCGGSTYADFCPTNDVPNTLVEYVTSGGNGVGSTYYICPKGCNNGACIE